MRPLRDSMILAMLACSLTASPVRALEMFGLTLEQSNAASLRQAVKQAGAVLVREGGKNTFDLYRSESLLAGSLWLFLGFTDNGNRFAFLEYSLPSRSMAAWQSRLTAKYGEPQVEPGRFLSDAVYVWEQAPIRVRLYHDFRHGLLRLEYSIPEQMQVLRGGLVETPGQANPNFY